MRAILTYHSLDNSGSPISVRPDVFASHVRWFSSGKVRVLPLAQLLAETRQNSPANDAAIALTFDDGFQNFADVAAPLLESHGLPATVFVVSDRVGRTNAWRDRVTAGIPVLPLMSWDTLAHWSHRGVQLGVHTRTHPWLDRLDRATLIDEIDGCWSAIEQHVGYRSSAFAYPYGVTSLAAASAVRDRFQIGVTTELRALAGDIDAALVPRLDAFYFRHAHAFDRWGSGSFRAKLALRAALRAGRGMLRRRGGE